MNRNALPIAGAVIAAGVAGYLFGAAHTSAAPTPPVSVSIAYEESGEARTVDLIDSEGHPVEVGSIAEEWPHLERDYADELDDGDQSTDTDG